MKVFIALMSVFLVLIPQSTQAQDKPPVVVELFSSQACPACPPADKYLEKLALMDNIIALSCHVDYFGRGSGDTAKRFCTNRQTNYIKQIGRKSHYTPQMMINGHMNVVGYDTDMVPKKINQAVRERIKPITITPKVNGVYSFNLPEHSMNDTANLMMAIYDKPLAITKRGRTVRYVNVISHLIPLGQWKGTNISRPVFPIISSKTSGFAILAQSPTTGKIIAAGQYKL